jgi:glycosyltransferase involved in cell wall biosynthesis
VARRPKASVIIPVFNGAAVLAKCLDCLAGQTYPRDLTEVVVVDNGSAEDIRTVVGRHLPSAVLLHEPTPGSYAARNRGLRDASGEVLAFTDADCQPRPDWLERGIGRLMSDERLGLVAGEVRMVPADPLRPTGVELYDVAYSLQQATYLEEQHFGVTANLFTRRSVVEKVGPFDARLLSRGDHEWGQRVWAAGFAQAYAPEAVVLHPARRTLRELVAKTRRLSGGSVVAGRLPKSRAARVRRWLNHQAPPTNLGGVRRQYRREFGWWASWRFYGAVYVKRLVTASEEIRVQLGGRPRR